MKSLSERAKNGGGHWTPSSSSGITDLPIHILMEILSKLPIKTLVATRSVCKSWLHLISDPYFAKLHQARAKVAICFQNCYGNKGTNKLRMGNFYFKKTSDHSLDLDLNTALELPTFGGNLGCFVNSCNGLLCYSSKSSKFALIWNPITSEFFTVPAPSRKRSRCLSMIYGLGFSRKTNRFKLLCIYGQRKRSSIAAEICTIEKEGCSWRTIKSCPYPIENVFGQTFLQGALHWFGKGSHMSIVSFDFDDEKFARVPLPPHFKTVNMCPDNKIGVLEDCLFVTEMTARSFNIWLMKDYGDQDSWTRVICSEFSSGQMHKYWWCMPLSYLDNGEILMMHAYCRPSYLLVYSPVRKRLSTMTSNVEKDRAITFNPSLVPLKEYSII